jgi:two-component system C4-dicarboxylate transport sensor histidine kinase DctB
MRRIRHAATALAVLACCIATAGLAYVAALHYYARAHAAEVAQRASLYALTLESQLARYESLPRVAALDPVLARLLAKPGDPALQQAANAYLKAVQTNADLSAAYVMDMSGKTLAASNWDEEGSFVGFDYAFRPYFIDAMKRGTGRFYGVGNTTKKAGYFLAVRTRRGARSSRRSNTAMPRSPRFPCGLQQPGAPMPRQASPNKRPVPASYSSRHRGKAQSGFTCITAPLGRSDGRSRS